MYQKASMEPKVFIFEKTIWGLSISHGFKSSKKPLGAILTLKKQKYFTKLKKLYQKSVRISFLGYVKKKFFLFGKKWQQ